MRNYVYIALLLIVAFVGWLFLFGGQEPVPMQTLQIEDQGNDETPTRDVLPLVTITGSARFKDWNDNQFLTVADDERAFDLLWRRYYLVGGYTEYPFRLNPGEICTFTIEIERFKSDWPIPYPTSIHPAAYQVGEFVMIPTLVRVVRDGKVIFDRGVCEVHNIGMEHRVVHFGYGFPTWPEGKWPTHQVSRAQFPHHWDRRGGGCIPGPRKSALAIICPACKAAFDKWRRDNNPPADSPPRPDSP